MAGWQTHDLLGVLLQTRPLHTCSGHQTKNVSHHNKMKSIGATARGCYPWGHTSKIICNPFQVLPTTITCGGLQATSTSEERPYPPPTTTQATPPRGNLPPGRRPWECAGGPRIATAANLAMHL